jgi:ABC-2 type transport system ATP-binding protein
MIEVQDLWKSYGNFHALLGISFSVRRGEIVGFCGPNGAGKTTCMKILTGYMLPSRGNVRVGGVDVVADSLETRQMIGYLPENTPLYGDMTVREYLKFCADLRGMTKSRADTRIDAVVTLCSLQPKFRAPIKTLSKGYRQRVGIAQALLHEPEVLILDEPTVGLDPNQVVPVREIIRDVGRDRTVILCSHILSEVEAVCGRVLIIHEGLIVGDGTPAELVAKVGGAADGGVGLERVFRGLTSKAGVA